MYRNGSKFVLFLMLFSMGTAFFLMPTVFAAMGISGEELSHLLRSPWFLIAQQLLLLLTPLLLWVYARRESFNNFLKFEQLDFASVAMIVGISLLIQPAMTFVSGLAGLFFPNIISDIVIGIMDYPFWIVLLAIAITPSIVEELVFRGYIQAQYEKFGIKKAAIISGLFFGIIHMNMQQFFYAFIAGIIFAYIVYYTKSIIAGILAHFVINASQVLLLRAVLLAESLQEELAGGYEAMPMPEITPLFAVMAVGIFALFTTPPAVLLLISLINRGKKAHDFTQPEIACTGLELPIPEEKPFMDPFVFAVVAIYAAFNIFTWFN